MSSTKFNQRKKLFIIKEITAKELKALLKANIIKNSKYGYIDKSGNPTGYYKTRNKAYIVDKYADIAKTLT